MAVFAAREPHLPPRCDRAYRRNRHVSVAEVRQLCNDASTGRDQRVGQRRPRLAAAPEVRRERPPRGRHRRHVHGRDADRRGDRPRRDREGALDAGRPVRRVHARGRARARRGRGRGGAASASSSTRPPSRRTRSSRARSRAAASSRPTASATCSRSRGRCGPTLYDTQFEKPPPLVPRDRAVGVVERLGPTGEVLTPLDDELGARRGRAAARARTSSRSRSACCTRTSTPSTSSGSARSSPRSCRACPSRSRPRSRPSSASTCARRRR